MKTYRSTTGPLRERPFYTFREIEDTCADALRQVGLFPAKPEPVRIERFIEKRFGVRPEYRALADGVLGFTRFGPKGVEEVVISADLVEQGSQGAERLVNSTLAHEAGHGLFQGHLFVLGQARIGSLFGSEVNEAVPKILCRDPRPQNSRGYDRRWWEFQANQAIGALLLPRTLAVQAVSQFLAPAGTLGQQQLDPAQREQAAQHLAEVFDVNPAVARIRLDDLFPEAATGQLTL